MAGKNYEIKTSLAIDGEQKFRQAIEDATRSMKVMDSEMRKAKAAYQAGGDGVDYFNAKSEALSGKVKQQEAIVKALEQAVEESAKTYGEASKQADTYRIKLNQAEATLIKMKKASQDADKEAEELGRDAKKVGQQISDGIGEGAEKAENRTKESFGGIMQQLDDIRQSAAIEAAISIGGAIVDTAQGLSGFVAENAELSTRIAMAQYNIERYGYRWDDVDDLIVRAAAVTGDHDGAMAAMSSIVQYGFDDIGMIRAAVDAIIGGVIFRPGMSMESLAEDILNTINTREASGAYAELVSEVLGAATAEEINAALAAANSQEEAAQIALSYLTENGLQTATQDLFNQNAELMEYNQQALELAEEWRQLSERLRPIYTAAMSFLREMLESAQSVLDWFGGGEGHTSLTEGMARVQEQLNETGTELGSAAMIMRGWEEGFSESHPNYYAALQRRIDNDTGAAGILWAELMAYPQLWGDRVRNTGWGGAIFDAAEEARANGAGAFNTLWAAMRQSGANLFEWLLPSAGAEEMPVGWEEYAANARTQMENELANGQGAHNAGTEMINQFGQGIEEGTAAPIAAVQNMVNQINSLLSGVGGGAYSLGLAGVSGVSLVVDGQELGRAVAGGVSSTLGRRVATRMYAD